MTTIAYNHQDKEVAVDSRVSRGNLIVTDKANKRLLVKGVEFFICGATCDFDLLVDSYFNGKSDLVPDASAITIDNGKAYRCGVESDGTGWKQELVNNDAMGSGADWAIAAMDFGCNSKDAVNYAKTRDNCTGGRVRVFKV